jgi:hypothetical protein
MRANDARLQFWMMIMRSAARWFLLDDSDTVDGRGALEFRQAFDRLHPERPTSTSFVAGIA